MTRSTPSFLFWLGMVIFASLMLYHTSDRVTELDRQLHSLNAQIEQEQESLHILKAEWVYLANPARIEAEAVRHLDLQPTATHRVVAMNNIASVLPTHDGSDPTMMTAQATQSTILSTAPIKSDMMVASAPRSKHDRVMASSSDHINDHMIMQHTAAVTTPDRIGALIGSLGLHQ